MRALASAGLRPPSCAVPAHSSAPRPPARALAIGLPPAGRAKATRRRSSSPQQQLLLPALSPARRIAHRPAAAADSDGPAGPTTSSTSTSTVVVASPPASPDLVEAVADAVADAAPVAVAAPAPPRVAVPLRLAPAVAYLPHPNKRSYGGEDAHFVTDAGGGCMGVADGVGGWADSGVNPAAYARGLMRAAVAHLERGEEGAVEAARAALEAPGGPETAGMVTCRAAARVDFGADGEDLSFVVSSAATVEAAAPSPSSSASSSEEEAPSSSSSSSSTPPLLFSVPAAHYQAAAAAGEAEASTSSPPLPDPRSALEAAHRLVRVAGSATAVLLQLDAARSVLSTVNLGDSGFMVLRRAGTATAAAGAAAGAAGSGAAPAAPSSSSSAAAAAAAIVYRSSPLQHFFDCPLQLGACPEYVDATDSADQADVRDIPILPGDVIVAGSDGLWDNCFDEEVASVVSSCFFAVPPLVLQPNPAGGDQGLDLEGKPIPPDARLAPALVSAKECAERLARAARTHAADERRDSPYAREARLQGLDLPWWEKVAATRFTAGGGVEVGKLTGGKMDDITVLVAQVVAAV